MMTRGSALNLFISYSHKDELLRAALGDHIAALQRDGIISTWHDRQIVAGQDWAGEIDSELEQADIIICMVSAGFLASSYCQDKELKRALERHDAGEALVIPVIVRPSDWISSPLGRLQALPAGAKAVTKWSNRDEAFLSIAQGIRQAAEQWMAASRCDSTALADPVPQHRAVNSLAISAPRLASVADVEPVSLDIPEGPVRANSPFYVPADDEQRCCNELDKPGALIRIKSPQGFGKSSLAARLRAYATSKGYRTAALNLEGTDLRFFASPDLFLQWFCASAGKELGVRVRKEDYWDDIFGANDNSRDYFETYLLKPDPVPLVLIIDNFDRIFGHSDIETDVCGLLRSWHELSRNAPLWERLRLVLSHSSESYATKDINQSPFNVGLPVLLGEWRVDQVRHLIGLHALSLSEQEINRLMDLVGGHPYLVRKALYELANGLPFDTFCTDAPTEAGVYGDHLRGLLRAVEENPALAEALRQVVQSSEPVKLRSDEAFKLESLGLVMPQGNLERPRCRLYVEYMADRLGC
jgi:hypothetical protein